jgi:type I restriction enzyme S subunit
MSNIPKGYKQTEVGVIPSDWEVRALKELAEIQRGASPRPIDSPIWYNSASTVGWVRISDVTASNGKHLIKTSEYFSDKGIAQSRYLPAGSLIMSICATVGMPVITQIDTCIHDGFVGFTKLRHVDQTFLYYKLKELETSFKSMGQTGSQNNLNSNLVRDCLVALPSLPEQTAIAAALSDTDALITSLEKLIAKKRNIKQGAMQELLTGKKRLPGFSGKWETKLFGSLIEINKGQQLNKSELTATGEYPDWNGGIEPSGYTTKWNMVENTITISEGGNSCGFVN